MSTSILSIIYILYLLNIASSAISTNHPNELYIFYNHTNAALWTQDSSLLQQYTNIIHKSVLLSLQNLTGHSMNISKQSPYQNQPWTYGGIVSWIPCMTFTIKLSSGPIDCPDTAFSDPSANKYDNYNLSHLRSS